MSIATAGSLSVRVLTVALGTLSFALIVPTVRPLNAAIITVDTLSDQAGNASACELRDAIVAANGDIPWLGCASGNGDDRIVFADALSGTLTLTANLPEVTKHTQIWGPVSGLIAIDGDDLFSILEFDGLELVEASVRNLTLIDGSSASGGGCMKASDSDLSVTDVKYSGCTGQAGGAISLTHTEATFVRVSVSTSTAVLGGGLYASDSSVLVEDSLFFNNNAVCALGGCSSVGGGALIAGSFGATFRRTTFKANVSDDGSAIYVAPDVSVDLEDCSISENVLLNPVGGAGGAVLVAGSLQVFGTIIAGNVEGDPRVDIANFGTTTSLGHNLIGSNEGAALAFPAGQPNANLDLVGTMGSPIDPLLQYGDHGGPLNTFLPLLGSPAIDQSACAAAVSDQRGYSNPASGLRIVDDPAVANQMDGCDIGSVEVGAESPVLFVDGFESGDVGSWAPLP